MSFNNGTIIMRGIPDIFLFLPIILVMSFSLGSCTVEIAEHDLFHPVAHRPLPEEPGRRNIEIALDGDTLRGWLLSAPGNTRTEARMM